MPGCKACGRMIAEELLRNVAATCRHTPALRETTPEELDAFHREVMGSLDKRLLRAWVAQRAAGWTESIATILGVRIDDEVTPTAATGMVIPMPDDD